MTTKKQMKTEINYVELCLNCLKQAEKSSLYKGKFEDKRTIKIVVGKVTTQFFLSKEEYKQYKQLEREHWFSKVGAK